MENTTTSDHDGTSSSTQLNALVYNTAIVTVIFIIVINLLLFSSKSDGIPCSYPRYFPFSDMWLQLFKYKLDVNAFAIDRFRAVGNGDKLWSYLVAYGRTLFLKHPEDIAIILSNSNKLHLESTLPDTVKDIFGAGSLIFQNGPNHLYIRKIFGSLLTPRALESFTPYILKEFRSMWKRLDDLSKKNDDSNNKDDVAFITRNEIHKSQIRLMCRILFGFTFETPEDEKKLEQLQVDFGLAEKALFSLPFFEEFKIGKKAALRIRALLHDAFDDVMEQRRKLSADERQRGLIGSAFEAISDALIDEGKDQDEKSLNDVKDNLHLLMDASQGTTMHATTSMLFFLNHPDNENVLQKLREEVAIILSDGDFTYEKSKNFSPYCDGCFYEAMRMAPIAGGFPIRSPMNDGTKVTLRDGTIVKAPFHIIFTWCVWSHDPTVFRDPDKMKPERWIPGHDEEVSTFAKQIFKPFGIGRHVCLGQRLALLVLRCALIAFAEKKDRRLVYDTDKIGIDTGMFPAKKVRDGLPARVVFEKKDE